MNTMNQQIAFGLALLVGAALGATAITGLNAQGKAPGAYVVIDIAAINNPDVFKTLLPKAGPANSAFDAQVVIRTENIVGLDGTPPKRFIVLAFDSMDKAKAWNASAATKEVNDIPIKSTHSRQFIVDGADAGVSRP
jgi:uncharacterized protein (DUF1330 family)